MVRVPPPPPSGGKQENGNRRDDNICIIFNARTSGLRGGRQPPPADHLLPRRLRRSSLPRSLGRPHNRRSSTLEPLPLSRPLPSRSLATPSNIPLKSIPPHCLLYLPELIIRTQIYCVSLAVRIIPPEPPRYLPRPNCDFVVTRLM